MSEIKKTFAERDFQDNFVKELEKYRWNAPDHLNGNIQKVTVDDLINNWRNELNRINADQLEGVPLTDNEFSQVMTRVNSINNSYEAAKLLSIEGSKGKIDGIMRDKSPGVTREKVTLTIFSKSAVSGGDSSYNIAREVVSSKGNRFDLVLLINGLPLINIEQKRTDKDLYEAFGQFKRYYRDGEFTNNFMAFSQMMVLSSEISTRYFATPKSLKDFNMSFVFGWADRENNRINDWKKVIENFLKIPMAHQMVGDYLVIDEALDEENKRHMLMRPYQVYALQAIKAAALGRDNDGIPHGGYIWHTTGSGKTITSFKTALFLSTVGKFDKIVFLVDRRELDAKTSENFKAYAYYESVDVDDTKYTHELKTKLNSSKSGIIVTTTFKLNSLVKDLNENSDNSLAEKRFVFIIDEAHRTTMGEMMVNIKEYFNKNALFYGFTGTPLFDENKSGGMIKGSELLDTTKKVFGPELHKYTIDQAIKDGNVLGFHVDYINTGEFKDYDDLRERLKDKILANNSKLSSLETERLLMSKDELEIEKEAKKEGLLVYQDENHIPRVVEYILKNWDEQSQNRVFNAILTVAYKNRVIAYYNEFKKQLQESGKELNVAMTFSFGNENDPENVSAEVMDYMFKDYAEITGIEFLVGNNKFGEKAYFEDIVDRTTRGGSGRNPKNIDLVIVADQLLTGYDSKRLNTLYVDRSLELQGLIQAYSRTNRILDKSKEFGTIINFQYPRITEEAVKRALILYGSGGTSSRAIVDKYDVAVDKLSDAVANMVSSLPDVSEWENLKSDEKNLEHFYDTFKDAIKQLNTVKQYYEYEWDDSKFGIDETVWNKYEGAYKNLKREEPNGRDDEVEDLIELVGKTRIVGTQKITAAHILELLGKKTKDVDGKREMDENLSEEVHEKIQELSDIGEKVEAELLKEFISDELVPRKIPSNISFEERYYTWINRKKEFVCIGYAEDWGVDSSLICKSLADYTGEENPPYITEIAENIDIDKAKNKKGNFHFEHYSNFTKDFPKWLAETSEKYSVK